jgi:gliding motility-associated-like protein
VVTAQDGTTKTYAIVVTRAKSSNANLSNLAVSGGTLAPVFASGTVSYTTMVANATTSVTITPTISDLTATIKVNGTTVASGTASGGIALGAEGSTTTITTVVTAQDGTTKTYSVAVKRAPSTNASLTSIALTPASSLTNAGTVGTATTYTTSVSNATTSVKVTLVTQDANATIKVNGVTVASGVASQSFPLVVGQTTITVVVTAQDAATTRIYFITITRATGPLLTLRQPMQQPEISVTKPTDTVAIENDGVMVHQGVSPNGDGINDFLTIDGISAYPNNRFTIIDRNGSLVYEVKGYDNSSKMFDGHSNINSKLQQPGTYFYSLDYVVNGQTKHKTGFIILKY